MTSNGKLSIDFIDSANLFLKGLIPVSLLKERENKVAINFSKNVKLDGFRKGKIPLSVINARFGDKISQDAEQETLSMVIESTLKDNHVETNKILGSPLIKKYNKSEDGIDIEIEIGIFPNINIDNYDTLIPEISLESISTDKIEDRLADMAKNNGTLIEVSRTLQIGDIANINFEGFIDGKAFDGGNAENFDLEIGSKQFIDGFEDQLIGMQKGEIRQINVKFPENYNAKHLANKDSMFKVQLNKIQERKSLSIDDDLAKKLLPNEINATLDMLKKNVENQLKNENKSKLFNDFKKPLVDNLLNGINVDLPKNIVEQELDVIFRNKISNIPKDELKELQDDKEMAKEKRESYREDAKRSVKLTLIIDYLAKKLNIAVSDDEVYQMLYYESLMMNKQPKELVEFYKQNNMIPSIKVSLLEGKVLNNLLESKLKS